MNELETRFEKWLFAIKHLDRLERVPEALREQVFEKFFEVAEIANFSRDEILKYEDSLKYYRDLKNSFDTAREEGREEGIKMVPKPGNAFHQFWTARLRPVQSAWIEIAAASP